MLCRTFSVIVWWRRNTAEPAHKPVRSVVQVPGFDIATPKVKNYRNAVADLRKVTHRDILNNHNTLFLATLAPLLAAEKNQERAKFSSIHWNGFDTAVIKPSTDQDLIMLIVECPLQDSEICLTDRFWWFRNLADPSSNILK